MNGQDAAFLRMLNRLGLLTDEEVEDVHFLFARFSGRRGVDEILAARGYVAASRLAVLRGRAREEIAVQAQLSPPHASTPGMRLELPVEAPLVVPVRSASAVGATAGSAAPEAAPDRGTIPEPVEVKASAVRDPALGPKGESKSSARPVLRRQPADPDARTPGRDVESAPPPEVIRRPSAERSLAPEQARVRRRSAAPRREHARASQPRPADGRRVEVAPRMASPVPRRALGFAGSLVAALIAAALLPTDVLLFGAPVALGLGVFLGGHPGATMAWGGFLLGSGALISRAAQTASTELDFLLGALGLASLALGWFFSHPLRVPTAASVASALAVVALLRVGGAAYFGS